KVRSLAAQSTARNPALCPWCGYRSEGPPNPFPLWPTPEEVGRVRAGIAFHGECCAEWMDWWAYGGENGSTWTEARDLWAQEHPQPIEGPVEQRSRFGRLFFVTLTLQRVR